jgi:hypothetical protein
VSETRLHDPMKACREEVSGTHFERAPLQRLLRANPSNAVLIEARVLSNATPDGALCFAELNH